MGLGIAEEVIRMSVGRWYQMYGLDTNYAKPIARMKTIQLRNVSEPDVCSIVEPYLYVWGRMGRVLGRVEYADWRALLATQIRQDSSLLEPFRRLQLQNADVGIIHGQVVTLYESFRGIVGNVAAGKVLHLLCPELFPPWDNATAEGLRQEYYGGDSCSAFSGEDYAAFVRCVQHLLLKYEALWSVLANQHQVSRARMVDVYLWWTVRRPFSLTV